MSETPKITLKKWNPNKQKLPFACLCIASRRSGKSYLIRYLYLKFWANEFDVVISMCPTDFADFYPSFLPGDLFYREYRPEVMEALMGMQEERIGNGEKPLSILVILDDCSDDREKYQSELQKIYTKGRHYNISIIYCTQATTLTGPTWRNNSDIILIGRANSSHERKNIVDNFLMGSADEEDLKGAKERPFFNALIKKNTADHNFIIINSDGKTGEFKDTILTYRAKDDIKYGIEIKKIKKRPIEDIKKDALKLVSS